MLLKYPICDCRLAKVLACARLAVGLLWLVGVTALNVSAQIYSELVREALQQPAQTSAPQNDQKTSHPSPTAPPAPDDKVTSHNPQDDDAAKINIFTGMGHAHGGAYQPLTGKQRWQLYLNQTFLPPAYFGIAWSSLVDHLSNQPPEWGHGASGLGLRVASRFGSNVVGGTLLGAGAALTGEDPRYIRSDDHGFWRRGRHAIAFTVLTYNREGETRPAIAGVSSLYASSVITQLWLPNHDHLWRDGMRDGTVQLGFSGMFNLIEEFWPELMHVVKRK
jgi:hypothetical protein